MLSLSKRASALLGQFPGPVTIRYARWFYPAVFLMFAVAAALIVSIVWKTWPRILHNPRAVNSLLLLVVIFGVPMGLLTISMIKGLPKVLLDAEGVTFEALFVSIRRGWDEISRFVPRVVYVGFLDASQPKGFWDKLSRVGSRGRRFLVGIFEVRSKDLVQLLTAWRERALSQQAGPWVSRDASPEPQ